MARPPSCSADGCHQAALRCSGRLSPLLWLPAGGADAPASVAPPLVVDADASRPAFAPVSALPCAVQPVLCGSPVDAPVWG